MTIIYKSIASNPAGFYGTKESTQMAERNYVRKRKYGGLHEITEGVNGKYEIRNE